MGMGALLLKSHTLSKDVFKVALCHQQVTRLHVKLIFNNLAYKLHIILWRKGFVAGLRLGMG